MLTQEPLALLISRDHTSTHHVHQALQGLGSLPNILLTLSQRPPHLGLEGGLSCAEGVRSPGCSSWPCLPGYQTSGPQLPHQNLKGHFVYPLFPI